MFNLLVLDNRTLFACNCILAAVFAMLFVGVLRVFPRVRGLRSMIVSFVLVVPACLLLSLRGVLSPLLSLALGNALMLGSFLLSYDAIARFCGGRIRTRQLSIFIGLAIFALVYFSAFPASRTSGNAARVIIMVLVSGATRALAGYELFLRSASKSNRTVTRLFGAFLIALATMGVVYGAWLVAFGAPHELGWGQVELSAMLAVLLLALTVTGFCFLLLACGELIALARVESERDPVTTTLNRSGIETRLQTELIRRKGNGQPLSVCLVSFDQYTSLEGTLGRRAAESALLTVAQTIHRTIRGRDHVGRYSTHEFLLVLPHTSWDEAFAVTQRLRRAAERIPRTEGSLRITLTFGSSEADPEDTRGTLISRAETALYLEKNEGNDRRRLSLGVFGQGEEIFLNSKPGKKEALVG